MENQQLFAKVAVFALLGVNVGAYYVFWPRQQSDAVCEPSVPRQGKGVAELLPEPAAKQAKAAAPKELAASFVKEAPAVKVVEPDKKQDSDIVAADDLVRKLLEHLEKEKRAVEPAPTFPKDEKQALKEHKQPDPINREPLPVPKTLPPLKADPLPTDRKDIEPGKAGVTSPLTRKTLPSPWILHTEPVGKQTLLIAKLQGVRSSVEFRILSERIETKDNEILALGNVVLNGAGLRGECQRVTLPLADARLVFEEKVRIVQVTGSLQGDRITWEFNPAAPGPSPFSVNPAVLGAPK